MIDVEAVFDKVVSHAAASGYFERVNQHEPKSKNPAGTGMTCAVWMQSIRPSAKSSGLAATSGRLEFTVRIYTSMTAEPQDAIDPAVLRAVNALMTAYSGDFELGGEVRHVDLLGAEGVPLSAEAGYLEQGGRLYRVMDILLPLIVNDLWNQEA